MAKSPLDIAIFPFWHWLTYGRLMLAGCWIVCLSIAFGRFVRSTTEFGTLERPPPKLFRNPFADTPPVFDTPETLAERQRIWKLYANAPIGDVFAEAERKRVSDFSVPGNCPEQGNYGHMEVDFGAQWMFGRMVVRGYGQELYNRNRQRQVMYESFPIEHEQLDHQVYRFPLEMRPARLAAENLKSDAELLMDWTVGGDKNDSPRWPELGRAVALGFAGGLDANPFVVVANVQVSSEAVDEKLVEDLLKPSCGGPLYPPVHAMLYAPLARIDDPRIAYLVFQLVSTLSIFVSGYSVRVMSGGRIWTPLACGLLLLYPGYQPGLTLGQNHIISLAIVLAGWALACRGNLYLGGFVWGFLAFKPVWAVAFGLVPLMMWRPRFLLGMASSGLGLCLATLPIVGIHGWQNWLTNGGEATAVYNRNSNWIHLSRDLSGIVRRLMLDLTGKTHEFQRNVPKLSLTGGEPKYSYADLVSWILLFAIFFATVIVYRIWGRPRKLIGLSAGFLFLGCYLCCFRFMYYDALLSSIGVAALFAYPMWYFRSDSIVQPGRFSALQWYPAVFFAMMILPALLLLIADANVVLTWAGFDNVQTTIQGEMKYEGFAVWAGILNVLMIAGYWVVFRVGKKSPAEAPATSRTVVARWNSLPMTLLLLLLLMHTYLLHLHPETTVTLFSGREHPRVFTAAMNYDYANDTFLITGLWMWAGWKLIRGGPRPEGETTT